MNELTDYVHRRKRAKNNYMSFLLFAACLSQDNYYNDNSFDALLYIAYR